MCVLFFFLSSFFHFQFLFSVSFCVNNFHFLWEWIYFPFCTRITKSPCSWISGKISLISLLAIPLSLNSKFKSFLQFARLLGSLGRKSEKECQKMKEKTKRSFLRETCSVFFFFVLQFFFWFFFFVSFLFLLLNEDLDISLLEISKLDNARQEPIVVGRSLIFVWFKWRVKRNLPTET